MNIFWKKLLFALGVSISMGIGFQNIAVGSALFAVLCVASFAPLYIKYSQDNPKHFWFKRKLFGWGWTPVTWQGWLIIAIYIGLMFLFAMTIDDNSPPREVAFTFILPAFFLTALLIRICYRKGEKPKWRWGKDLEKY